MRYKHTFPDNSPVPDFSGQDIICNKGGSIPIVNIPATAGPRLIFNRTSGGVPTLAR